MEIWKIAIVKLLKFEGYERSLLARKICHDWKKIRISLASIFQRSLGKPWRIRWFGELSTHLRINDTRLLESQRLMCLRCNIRSENQLAMKASLYPQTWVVLVHDTLNTNVLDTLQSARLPTKQSVLTRVLPAAEGKWLFPLLSPYDIMSTDQFFFFFF